MSDDYSLEAVIAIADIFEENFEEHTDDSATACLHDAAAVCVEYDIGDVDHRIDLICEGAEWYMDRKSRELTETLREELDREAEKTDE